jgi:hypothetical protein
VEDYVLFKALATRDRDADDAASVLRRMGEIVDYRMIEEEVQRLSREIPDWDVGARWEAIKSRGGRGT